MDAYEQAMYGMTPSYQLTEEEKKQLRMQQLISMGAALMAGRGNFVNNLGQAMLVGQNQGSEGMQDLRRNKLADAEIQYRNAQMMNQQRKFEAEQAQAAAAQQAAQERATRLGSVQDILTRGREGRVDPASFSIAPNVDVPPDAARRAAYEQAHNMSIGEKDVAASILNAAKEFIPTYGTSPIETLNNGKPGFAQVSSHGGAYPLNVTPRPKVGAASVSDFTPQSMATFSVTGNYADLVPFDRSSKNISNTQVHVAPGQAEWDKTIQKSMGEQYNQIQGAAKIGREKLANLETINQLLEGATTGGFTPAMTKVANAAESFGIKLDPKLGPKQAADMLSKQSALLSRNPAGGAGMPGNLSNKDLDFLVEMTPGLYQSAEGRRIHMETMRRLQKRDAWIARTATKYRMDEVGFSTKFQDEIDAYDANLSFKDLADQARALTSGQRTREPRN